MIQTDDWTESAELQSPRMQPAENDVRRALPHALGPEKSLLSSMLQEPQEYIGLAIEEKLTKEHFYLPSHSTLFNFMVELFESGQEIEIVSLVQKLLDRGLLERCGGASAVADLLTYSPSSGHFRHHLRHVKEKYVLRCLIQNANETIAAAYDQPDEVAELLDRAESQIMAIREHGTRGNVEPSNKQVIEKIIEEFQELVDGKANSVGISTGFAELDALGVHLKPGEMFVVAARPSMGKTALMINIVERVCLDGDLHGYVFSAEMTREAVYKRLLFSRAKFALSELSHGYKPNKGDLQRIQRSAMDIAASKIACCDSTGLTVGEIRAKARRRHRKNPLSLIAIDYLQLLRSTSKQAANSREREVAEISSGIKNLAKELGVPIVLLAQLNRGPESRTGKNLGKPRMSDLRESGSIEQDADMVGLLYRAAYYADGEDEKSEVGGRSELIIAKNRNGPTGTANLTFIPELMRFEDGSPDIEPEILKQTVKNRWED